MESLSRVGVLSIDGLKAILKAWQGAPVSIGWRDVRGLNWTTLKILEEAGAVCEHTEQDVTRIVNQWHMPLVGIELAENKKMTLAQAYKRRDALFEAFMAREYGDPYE